MQMWTPTRRKHYEIALRSILFPFFPKLNSSQYTSGKKTKSNFLSIFFSTLFFWTYLNSLHLLHAHTSMCTTEWRLRIPAVPRQCFCFLNFISPQRRDTVPSAPSQHRASVCPPITCTSGCARSCTVPLAGLRCECGGGGGVLSCSRVSSHKWISPHSSLSIKEAVCAQAAVRGTPLQLFVFSHAAATCYLPYFPHLRRLYLSPVPSHCLPSSISLAL